MGTHHTQLTAEERDQIALWKSQSVSLREIARRLGRSISTISDEVARNSHMDAGYVAIHAQRQAERRKSVAGQRHPLKDAETYAYVHDKLRSGWSPELIAGRRNTDQGETVITHETIYQFIYASENRGKRLWEYLPRGQEKRRKQTGRSVHRSRIPQRVSIHERPEIVNAREEFGHWEGDTVVGKGRRDGIHTEVERMSRFLAARKVPRIAAADTIRVQRALFGGLPSAARHSTTLDNGREHTKHMTLRLLGMRTYFADPYSSWQRGTNEFHNGLLRRYFPKGTDFSTVPDDELQDVVAEINNRPRKCLAFRTPAEVFSEQTRISGVRIAVRM